MEDYPKRREGARTIVTWPAVVLSRTNRMPCAVVDVSVRGAKLEIPSDVPEKSYVLVICPQFGSLDGYIAWRKGRYAGIRFTDPGAAISLRPFLGASAETTVTATVKFGRKSAT